MISPFTPDDLDLVAMLLRSRYLSHTPFEEIEAEVQLDLADLARWRFHTRTLPGPWTVLISRQPTWEVHHSEGVFAAHRSD
jgi:hypothetical protein